MREYNLIFGMLIARKLHGLFPLSISILIAHTPETSYPSLFIFTNKPKTMAESSSWKKERDKRVLSGIIGLMRFSSYAVLNREFLKPKFGQE